MSVLCQIALVDDEQKFINFVNHYYHPPSGFAGWGRFYGEVPAIGTTLQINWSDYELVNNLLFPENHESDHERISDYFKIIYHHRHLVPKPEYYSTSSSDPKRSLNVGHYTVSQCTVYVVKASADIYV
ncbi:MAG: hypothetical protein V7K48_32470 [Nostoc sp.]|uniref:hypothetical protein n=1 Tax=Nostoc sp. TaxID=1180 RepID=UPI002FFA43F1